MAQSKRDIIFQQLKTTWENRNEIRESVIEKLNATKVTAEATAKILVEQSKESPLVHEFVAPILENERTEKAVTKLQERFGENRFLKTFDQYRKDVIEAKVSKAKTVEPNAAETSNASASTETPVTEPTAEPKKETTTIQSTNSAE